MLTLLPLVLTASAQDPNPKLTPDPVPAPALTPVPGSLPEAAPAPADAAPAGATPSPSDAAPSEAPVGTPAPHSGGGGIVVRLDAGATTLSSPVVVTLMPPFGTAPEVTLEDAGTGADVTAGDNVWSAAGQAEGDTYKVSVRAGDQTWDGGQVSWEVGATQRDLSIVLADGKIEAHAGTSGQAGTVSGQAPVGSPAPVAGPVAGGGSGGGATAWLAVGAGGLLLAALAWVWVNGGARSLPKHLARLPEPAAFGGGTPAWTGPSQWVVRPDDRAELLPALLATLARGRRVLVAAPAGTELPAVAGGSVWRSAKTRASDLADALDALAEGGHAVALVDLRGAEGFAAVVREVEPGMGVIAVVDAAVEHASPVVSVTRAPGGWTVSVAGATVDLRVVDGILTPARRS